MNPSRTVEALPDLFPSSYLTAPSALSFRAPFRLVVLLSSAFDLANF